MFSDSAQCSGATLISETDQSCFNATLAGAGLPGAKRPPPCWVLPPFLPAQLHCIMRLKAHPHGPSAHGRRCAGVLQPPSQTPPQSSIPAIPRAPSFLPPSPPPPVHPPPPPPNLPKVAGASGPTSGPTASTSSEDGEAPSTSSGGSSARSPPAILPPPPTVGGVAARPPPASPSPSLLRPAPPPAHGGFGGSSGGADDDTDRRAREGLATVGPYVAITACVFTTYFIMYRSAKSFAMAQWKAEREQMLKDNAAAAAAVPPRHSSSPGGS